ncbi:hypothetical protein GCK32_012637, partial [Trichostrongylus colubriformis]
MKRTKLKPEPAEAGARETDSRSREASGELLFDFDIDPDYDFTVTLADTRPSASHSSGAPAHLFDTVSLGSSSSETTSARQDPAPTEPKVEDMDAVAGEFVSSLQHSPPRFLPIPSPVPASSAALQHLSLDSQADSSADQPSTSAASAAVPRVLRVNPPAAWISAEESLPPKRARVMTAPPALDVRGIQKHPAQPPQLESTPPDYSNEFSHLHPWGKHVVRRRAWDNLSDDMVTPDLPTIIYRHIPPQHAYFATRFVRSLFPRRFLGQPSPTNRLPIMEIMRLNDIIAFRQHAVQLTMALLGNRYRDDTDDIRQLPSTEPGPPPTVLAPPLRDCVRPVLYQVVSRGYGQGVILEAKDFFIPGPDLPELQCLPMTQSSVHYLTQTRGFDRDQLSVKDFVWVFSLRPTPRALRSDNREEVLELARRPRSSIVDSPNPYFLQVHEFIPVTPPCNRTNVLGMVIAVTRRGRDANVVNNIYIAVEG